MADPDLAISGGAGGIGAHFDGMRTESAELSAAAAQLVEQSVTAAGIALDADLLASTVLSPVTASAAKLQIVFATGQMLMFATEAGVTAVFLAGAADAYETVDRSLALAADAAVNAGTFAVGVIAMPLVGALALAAAADVALVYVGGYGLEVIEALGDGVAKTLADPSQLTTPSLIPLLIANTLASFDGAEAQATVDVMLALQLTMLNELAGDNAWAVDLIAQGAPGLLAGLTLPLMLSLGPVATKALLEKLTGTPWPPTSYEQALEAIIGGGNKLGYFNDGPLLTADDLVNAPEIVGPVVAIPTSLEGLLVGSAQIDEYDTYGGVEDSFARIRITEVEGPPQSYIVQIPSTQSWDLAAGSTPNDVTADTAAMLAQQTALSSAVDAAMRAAGISPTDPVMLQGFSLGGITAGQMAADPSLSYNITHVVTAGAPIANFDIPSSVQVLSMEFEEDPVAKLDGNSNPDSANWTTAQAGAPSLASDKGSPVGIAGDQAAHKADRYAVMARELGVSFDPSVSRWLDSATHFFPPDPGPGIDVATSTNPADADGPLSTTTTVRRESEVAYSSTTTDYGAQRK